MSERPLTVKGVADLYGVRPQRVYGWIKDGHIRPIRLPGGPYRFRRSDLEEFETRCRDASSKDPTTGSDSEEPAGMWTLQTLERSHAIRFNGADRAPGSRAVAGPMDSRPRPAYPTLPGDDCGDHASLYGRPAPACREQDHPSNLSGARYTLRGKSTATDARPWRLFPCALPGCGGWIGQEGDLCPACGHVMGRPRKVDH